MIAVRFGANLLQTYNAAIWAHAFQDLADWTFANAAELLRERAADPNLFHQLTQIERFCRAKSFKLLDENRLRQVPETTLQYDIDAWASDPDSKPLAHYEWPAERVVRFPLTPEQYQLVEDVLDQFGHNDLGRGKTLIRVPFNAIWRAATYDPAEIADSTVHRIS